MLKKMLRVSLVSIGLSLLFALNANAHTINDLFHQSKDPVVGNPKGKVTVVEFFDYQCSHCADMGPVLSQTIHSNPNVRVVFKEFPIRGPMSDMAARAALAANMQGKYKEFHHSLLSANQPLTEEFIFETAKSHGINVEKMKKDMHSASVNHQIKSNSELAEKLKLTGTPAFFIGETNSNSMHDVKFVLGGMDQRQLQKEIHHYSR